MTSKPWLVLLGISVLLCSGCGRAIVGGQPASDAGPDETGPIIVGALWEGNENSAFEPQRWMTLAVEQFNAQGGRDGRPVELIFREIEPRQGPARDAAREMIDMGASIIVGPLFGFAGLAVAELGETQGVPVLTNFASGLEAWDDLAPPGERFSYGLRHRDRVKQATGITITWEDLECSEVYYITDFAEGEEAMEIDFIRSRVTENGMTFRGEAVLPSEVVPARLWQDYSGDTPAPDCVVWNHSFFNATGYMRQWAGSGANLPAKTLILDGPGGSNTWTRLPEEHNGNTYFMAIPLPDPNDEDYQDAVRAFRGRWGVEPLEERQPTRVTYDMISIALMAIATAPSTSQRDLADAIGPTTRSEVMGATQLVLRPNEIDRALRAREDGLSVNLNGFWADWEITDDDGRHNGPYRLYRVLDGAAEEYEPIRTLQPIDPDEGSGEQ